MDEALAIACLICTLAFAVARPRGLPEVVVAAPAALLLLATGVVTLSEARDELSDVGATVAFLAAVLVLGELCARAGLFEAAGEWLARGSRGRPVTLLGLVVLLCSVVTAVLSLDATVVFLTPVVFATAGRWARGPGPTRTPASTSPTRPRCCCRSPTCRTCWPSRRRGCRSRASAR